MAIVLLMNFKKKLNESFNTFGDITTKIQFKIIKKKKTGQSFEWVIIILLSNIFFAPVFILILLSNKFDYPHKVFLPTELVQLNFILDQGQKS